MVLCKYFLNGNCRFGAKCVNEHLDIKQLLKSDVESAVNGNQWPLSCFGPFKEKPSIPNFIEDQSFEEIRMLCYGSKKQNFFDSFNQQFTKEVLEAKNKLKMLLTLNKDVMDVVINLYNSSEPPKGAIQQNSNPFGLSSGANPQQSTNLFGNSTSTQSSMFGSSPFGGAYNAAAGNSVFGGGQKSIIGQSAFSSFAGQPQQQQPQQTSNLFGSMQSQQQQPQQQQTNSFGGNIFSQVAQTPGGASIFGATQQPQQQPQPFGATNTSAFGQPINSSNIFAQAAQQTQQQPAVGGNIFAQAVQQPQQTQPPSFGMFSQATQQAPPAFGAQMTTQSPFGAVQQQQQRPFFGQTQQQQSMQQQQQLQMQQQQQQQQQLQQQQNAGNIFSTAMQKQQQQPQQQPFQAQQPPSGIFATAVANSPFGPPAQPQQQQQQQQTNIFAQAVGGFPQSQQQTLQQPVTSDRTYSKMENLRPEEIEAFQAETFELGKIPFSPPPRELVN